MAFAAPISLAAVMLLCLHPFDWVTGQTIDDTRRFEVNRCFLLWLINNRCVKHRHALLTIYAWFRNGKVQALDVNSAGEFIRAGCEQLVRKRLDIRFQRSVKCIHYKFLVGS